MAGRILSLVFARDRIMSVDPRLAGMNYAENGTPATFYVNLPSAGTYNLSLAMGDAGYTQCWTQCQVQFLDGSTVVGTVTAGLTGLGYFYDATGTQLVGDGVAGEQCTAAGDDDGNAPDGGSGDE